MGFGDNFQENVSEFGHDGKWWINADDMPIKVAIVGQEIVGCAQFIRGQGWIAAEKGEGDAKLIFAVNAWDGSKCRVLTGSHALYTKLRVLGQSTAGLDQIWVEVGKGADNRYYAKYDGDLTDKDKGALVDAELEDLTNRCDWYNDGLPI